MTTNSPPLRPLVPLTVFLAMCLAGIHPASAREIWYVLTPADRRTLEVLDESVSFEFVDQPLSSVFQEFEARIENRIGCHHDRMQESGVSLSEPINKKLSEVPLRDALHQILEPLGLDYYVRDGVLIVTTASDPNLVPRVYDVSEFVDEDRSSKDLAELLRQAASRVPKRPVHKDVQPEAFVAPFGRLVLVHTSLRGHHEIDRVLDLLEIGLKEQR